MRTSLRSASSEFSLTVMTRDICCRSSPSLCRTGRQFSTRSSSGRAPRASGRGTSRRCSRHSKGNRIYEEIFEQWIADQLRKVLEPRSRGVRGDDAEKDLWETTEIHSKRRHVVPIKRLSPRILRVLRGSAVQVLSAVVRSP